MVKKSQPNIIRREVRGRKAGKPHTGAHDWREAVLERAPRVIRHGDPEARALIPALTPEWTDHNPADPGITL